jgi:micrococcal nuclease
VGKSARFARAAFAAFILAIAASGLGFLPPEAQAETIRGTVVTVFDGDTVEVALDDGRVEKVRYLLIDTPELHHPKRGVEEFGLEAALANRALVLGKRVRLETDVQSRDRYGRLLATAWLDLPQGSVLVNERLVEEGFALPFTLPPNVHHAERIHAALLRARSEGRGFWNAAAGRLFTPRQVWADLPLLAGSFITLDMRIDETARSKTRWILSEKGARTSLVIYDDRPGLFGAIPGLKGKRLRVIGKVQPSYQGAEILLVDPAQVLSVTQPPTPFP